MTWLDALTERSLGRQVPTRAEALRVPQSGDDEQMDVVAAFRVRPRYFEHRRDLVQIRRRGAGTARPANA